MQNLLCIKAVNSAAFHLTAPTEDAQLISTNGACEDLMLKLNSFALTHLSHHVAGDMQISMNLSVIVSARNKQKKTVKEHEKHFQMIP